MNCQRAVAMDEAHLFPNPLMLYWARAALWECLRVPSLELDQGDPPLPLCNIASALTGKGPHGHQGQTCTP